MPGDQNEATCPLKATTAQRDRVILAMQNDRVAGSPRRKDRIVLIRG